MKILVIAADLIPGKLGGAEQHIIEVIKRLSSRHDFLIFAGEDTSISKEFNGNVVVQPINYPKIPNLFGIAFIIFGLLKIKKTLGKKKYDLIWAKQTYPQAVLGALLKNYSHKPLYVTAQNPKLHYEELVIKGTVFRPFHHLFARFLDPVIHWSFSKADIVAAVSKYSADLAKEMGAKNIRVIPNGVEVAKYKQGKSQKNQKLRIVTTSALIPRNGIDILIEAVALLPSKIKWDLRIAGEGPEKKDLELRIKSHKLNKKVKLVGRVSNENIPDFLLSSDLFVRPSRKEGFGVAFLEALATGIPVIATPVGGIRDFINNQETGLLVEPNNPQQVKDAIISLIDNKKLYKKLVTKGKLLVKHQYSWETITDEVEKALLSIS
jgi:glycosyltransferase involved in cell wall biosynthesis